MLSSLAKEHQQRQLARRQEIESHRQEAITAASQLTGALVDELNCGVAQAYLNQRRLDAEGKQLQMSVATLTKQTNKWLTLINNFNSQLKQLGDVENWARSIEADMRLISTSLEYCYKVGPK